MRAGEAARAAKLPRLSAGRKGCSVTLAVRQAHGKETARPMGCESCQRRDGSVVGGSPIFSRLLQNFASACCSQRPLPLSLM